MTEERKNTWQFPVPLKLTIIWIYLISMFRFYDAVTGLIFNFFIDLTDWVAAFVFLGLANGLASGNNSSRIWTICLVSLGSLIRLYLLAVILIKDIDPIGILRFFSYDVPLTGVQLIILLGLNLVINAGVILTLAKSEIKEFFLPQTLRQETK